MRREGAMSTPDVVGSHTDLMRLAARGREFSAGQVYDKPVGDPMRIVGTGIDARRKITLPKSDDHDPVEMDVQLRILNQTDGPNPVLFVRLKVVFFARETPGDALEERIYFVSYTMTRSAAEYLQAHPEEEPNLNPTPGELETVELSAEQFGQALKDLGDLVTTDPDEALYGVFRDEWPMASDMSARLLRRLIAFEPELTTMIRTEAIDAGVRQRDLPNILAWIRRQPEAA